MSIGSVSNVPYVSPLQPANAGQPAAEDTVTAEVTSPTLVGKSALSPATAAALISQQGDSDPSASSTAVAAPDKKMQSALQALKSLTQRSASANDDKKAIAMKKLALLKDKLKALMMFGGDPKQRAQAAAAIIKEIAAAAKAYAQAGGDPGASVAPDAGAVQSAAVPTVDAAAVDPETVTTAASDQTAESPGAATGVPSDAAAAQAPMTGRGDEVLGEKSAGPGSNRDGLENPPGRADSVPTPRTTSGSNEMDQAFVKEVRRLASRATEIIKTAEQDMSSKHGSVDSAVEAALAEMDAATRQIGAQSTSGYEVSTISEPPAPAVSISA